MNNSSFLPASVFIAQACTDTRRHNTSSLLLRALLAAPDQSTFERYKREVRMIYTSKLSHSAVGSPMI